MQLKATNGASYSITPEDRLWLLRAVEAEGEPRELVAKALVGRFLWLLPQGTFPTLTRFVRAYSQPVNPRWAPGGDKWEASKANLTEAQLAKLARRRQEARERTEFTTKTQTAVREALEHAAPLFASDFSAASPTNRERVSSWLELVAAGDRTTNDLFRLRSMPAGFGYRNVGDDNEAPIIVVHPEGTRKLNWPLILLAVALMAIIANREE